jgi:hypothetical protein
VLEAILSIRKLQFTNTKQLTNKQLEQMSKRTPNSISIESLKVYQNEFDIKSKVINLTDELAIRLKVPNIPQHIQAGYTWITDIENNFADALLKSEKEREQYLMNQSKCTIARNYSHFVDVFIRKSYDNDTEIIEEDDDIELRDSMLNDLDTDSINKFIDGCVEFINDITVSIIAVPNYKCPKCNEKQVINTEAGLKSELIPIDPSTVFSILLSQRVRMIQMR